jgi:hypothetical protein
MGGGAESDAAAGGILIACQWDAVNAGAGAAEAGLMIIEIAIEIDDIVGHRC